MTGLVLKKAEEADAQDLYLWRNDPAVRELSFSPDPFSFEDHLAWFRARLSSTDCTMYIAYLDSQKIGAVRFETKGKDSKVSVVLAAECRGKGWGAAIIRAGTESFIREKNPGGLIVAEVMCNNPASLRAFAKAGFRQQFVTYVFEHAENVHGT